LALLLLLLLLHSLPLSIQPGQALRSSRGGGL